MGHCLIFKIKQRVSDVFFYFKRKTLNELDLICRSNYYLEIEYSICGSNYYLEIEYSLSNQYLEIEYLICRSN